MNNIITTEEALRKAAEQLDISPSMYKKAKDHFESLKSYLFTGDYTCVDGDAEIYLQGSFKLGTEIRPYKGGKDADYDIDIVCCIGNARFGVTPNMVKHQVGDHLKGHGTYSKMLDTEGRRCWTLNYAEQDGIGFHVDILPSVETNKNISGEYSNYNGISITSKCDKTGEYSWSTSNPKGLAKWFYDKNKILFDRLKYSRKQVIFENYRKDGFFSTADHCCLAKHQ